MEINLPVKPKGEVTQDQENSLKASKALTILIGKDNKLYWYLGLATAPIEGLSETNLSADGIRKVLLEKNSYN